MASHLLSSSPQKRMPLHDDSQEKAERWKSRHALLNIKKNHLKLAASPTRRVTELNAGISSRSSCSTMPFTPVKRIPILANFQKWIRLATDNKINAGNSWTVALIDYFYDMSLLKDGDKVNFQRASSTLDGCIKIYTSRVDSIATETGRLLNGLADSQEKEDGGIDNRITRKFIIAGQVPLIKAILIPSCNYTAEI